MSISASWIRNLRRGRSYTSLMVACSMRDALTLGFLSSVFAGFSNVATGVANFSIAVSIAAAISCWRRSSVITSPDEDPELLSGVCRNGEAGDLEITSFTVSTFSDTDSVGLLRGESGCRGEVDGFETTSMGVMISVNRQNLDSICWRRVSGMRWTFGTQLYRTLYER